MDPDAREPIPLGYGQPFARRRPWLRVLSLACVIGPMLALGVGLGKLASANRYKREKAAEYEAAQAALARRNAAAVEKTLAKMRAATEPADQ